MFIRTLLPHLSASDFGQVPTTKGHFVCDFKWLVNSILVFLTDKMQQFDLVTKWPIIVTNMCKNDPRENQTLSYQRKFRPLGASRNTLLCSSINIRNFKGCCSNINSKDDSASSKTHWITFPSFSMYRCLHRWCAKSCYQEKIVVSCLDQVRKVSSFAMVMMSTIKKHFCQWKLPGQRHTSLISDCTALQLEQKQNWMFHLGHQHFPRFTV